MTPITLPSGKYLIVDVPDYAEQIELHEEDGKSYLTYHVNSGTEDYDILRSAKAPGSYTLIGVDPLNLTEDEWKVVVRQYHNGYENYYSQMVSLHLTATESGSSLLTANGHKPGSAVILKVN